MNEQDIVEQINNLLINAKQSGPKRDWDNQHQHLENVKELYKQLSPESKTKIQKDCYYVHKELGHLYYIKSQHKKALYHLQKAKKLSDFKKDDFLTKALMDHFEVDSSLKLYLKTNSKSYLKNLKRINSSLLKNLHKIPPDYHFQIEHNQSVLEEIGKGAKVKTVIWFEIPFPLFIQEQNPIKFRIDGVLHILEIEILENPMADFRAEGGGFVELIEDKYGLVNRSKITLTIFKYIDPDERVEMKTFSEKNEISKIILEATNALNYFIECYRVTTGNYWIETVYYKMIPNFTFEIKVGHPKSGTQTAIKDHLIRYSPTEPPIKPWLKNTTISNLEGCLEKGEISLWQILLLDAKDYLLRKEYREAIYSINGHLKTILC